VFPGRAGDLALRPVLARCHHLSDADGKIALRYADRERADEVAVQRAGLPSGVAWRPRLAAMDRRDAGEGGPSEPLEALRQPVGIPVRPPSSQCELSLDVIDA